MLPQRAYADDAGLDLAACDRVALAPGERATVGTGVAVAIPAGYAGYVQPRSGLAEKHGITLVNTPGLVDSGYRGELRIILLNTDREHAFEIEPVRMLAHLLPVPPVELRVVDEPPSERGGAAGFLGGLVPLSHTLRPSPAARRAGASSVARSPATWDPDPSITGAGDQASQACLEGHW